MTPIPDMMVTGPALELVKKAGRINPGDWVLIEDKSFVNSNIRRDLGGKVIQLQPSPIDRSDDPDLYGVYSPGGGHRGLWWIYAWYVVGWYPGDLNG